MDGRDTIFPYKKFALVPKNDATQLISIEGEIMNEKSESVKSFIIDNFLFGDADGLTDEMSFIDEGIIDSTGILELVGYLEETFSIKIEDQELIPENFDSVNNISQYLHRKLNHLN